MAQPAQDRAHIVALLRAESAALAARFGTQELALFGSAARDELQAHSDVDVLVDFIGPASYDAYFGLKDHLEGLLGRPVDLVTRRGLKARAQAQVQQELIRVA
jgi:predicted nucleotidyltransferase